MKEAYILDNPFKIERIEGHVVITAKIDILDDLIFIIEKLLDLSQQVRKYRRFQEAERKAIDPTLLAAKEAKYQEIIKKTYLTFMKHLKNDCRGNQSLAIKETYKELGILRIDAEILIAEGKKIEKQRTGLLRKTPSAERKRRPKTYLVDKKQKENPASVPLRKLDTKQNNFNDLPTGQAE